MSEMKQCYAYGEEVKSTAKRCPHCQTWLRKWGIDPSDPKFVIWWIVIVITVIVTTILATAIFKSEDKKFHDYRSRLTITESKLHYSYEECCSSVSVLGKIKNESDIPWEDIHFEVQFYDSENKLIDTFSERPW